MLVSGALKNSGRKSMLFVCPGIKQFFFFVA